MKTPCSDGTLAHIWVLEAVQPGKAKVRGVCQKCGAKTVAPAFGQVLNPYAKKSASKYRTPEGQPIVQRSAELHEDAMRMSAAKAQAGYAGPVYLRDA